MPLEAGRHAALVLNCTDPSSDSRHLAHEFIAHPLFPLACPFDARRPAGPYGIRPGTSQYPAPSRVGGTQRTSPLGGAPRRLDARGHALQRVEARRQAVGRHLRALPGEHRRPAFQPARLGRGGIRAVQAALRRHDPQRRRRPCVRHLRALPAAQSRAHQVRHRAARQGAGLDAERELRVRSREGSLGSSQAELDDFWRKRVKNDSLSLLLTGKSWDETASCSKSATRPRSSASTR